MGAATSEERCVLTKFRDNLKDLKLEGFLNSDLGLLQWLRARDLNVEKAEEMLRKSLKWRQENDIDSLLKWKPPAAFTTLCPVEYCGYDLENSPICFIPFGSWDSRKVVNLGHRDSYGKYSNQIFETLKDKAKQKVTPSGLPVTEYTLIVDVKGLSMQTLACLGAINMYLDALKSMEANYPETIRKLFVVNASRVFAAFFALVKPMLSQRTFGKIFIYNNDVDKWMAALLENIGQDNLPPQLLKSRKNSTNSSPKKELTRVTVAPGQDFELHFNVPLVKSILSWTFQTKSYSMDFSLSCDDVSVVPKMAANSHLETQEGVIVCERKGLYTFLWENTNSGETILKYCVELTQAEH